MSDILTVDELFKSRLKMLCGPATEPTPVMENIRKILAQAASDPFKTNDMTRLA